MEAEWPHSGSINGFTMDTEWNHVWINIGYTHAFTNGCIMDSKWIHNEFMMESYWIHNGFTHSS